MHAYAAFLRDQMDERGWSQSELARRAGLTRQTINAQLKAKGQGALVQRPDQETIDGLARAFAISPDVLLAKVAEAMGLPSQVDVNVRAVDLDEATDVELLGELARRLRIAADDPATAQATAYDATVLTKDAAPGVAESPPTPHSAGSSGGETPAARHESTRPGGARSRGSRPRRSS